MFSDIGLSDLEYHKIFHSENLNLCLRTLQGFITVLWVKLGEEYNGKGSERIGPTDLIGMRGLGHMAPCRGVHHACTTGWTCIWTGILGQTSSAKLICPHPDRAGCSRWQFYAQNTPLSRENPVQSLLMI